MRSASIIDNSARLDRADAKIAAQSDVIAHEDGEGRLRAQRVMNEMRGNKAFLELNRALLDFAPPLSEAERLR